MPANEISAEIKQRLRGIKLLLMDCDGVLTDGRLFFSEAGETIKVFDVKDGQGIVDWKAAGNMSGVISGRSSAAVELRMKQLGVDIVYQNCSDKRAAFSEVLAKTGLQANECAYIGDDLPDIDVMGLVGFAVAVGDAVEKVRSAAHYVTERKGGRGAVRETIDVILEEQRLSRSL